MRLKFIIFLFLFSSLIFALRNPSAVYCEALGYEYVVETTVQGDTGYCKVGGSQTVDSWDFLQGKAGQEFSYCSEQGYGMKTVNSSRRCLVFLTDECAVCVLENGTEVEVTELMGLSFEETTCGDGTCGIPENITTCPQDCPTGSADAYCDSISDNICDPDCREDEDPDCVEQADTSQDIWPLVLGAVIAVLILALLIKKFLK